MKKAFILDFELNKPFMYIEEFRNSLKRSNFEIDMFKVEDAGKNKKSPLPEKIDNCNFMILRKPLTFLMSDSSRERIQTAVLKGHKNILIMYSFSDRESLGILNNFLTPFNLESTELMIYDEHENIGSKRIVIFRKSNECFDHPEIFEGVEEVIIPQAHHIRLNSPSKAMIRGNPTTVCIDPFDMPIEGVEGNMVTVGAYYEESARVVLMDSTLLNNKYFGKNKRFITNVIDWISEPV